MTSLRKMGARSTLLAVLIWVGSSPALAQSNDSLKWSSLIPETLQSRMDSSQRNDLEEALKDAGENTPEFINALENLEGSFFADALFLILNMPHLDRLEMTREILVHHIIYADSARRAFPWRIPDSLYQQYILTYRIGEEPLTDWRRTLWNRVKGRARECESGEEYARRVNRWVSQEVQVQEPQFFGGQQAPDQTLTTRRGTKQEIAALATALLKTAGIPSRQVKVEALLGQSGAAQWAEIYSPDQNRWLPLYPDAPDHFGDFGYCEPDTLRHNVSYATAKSAFEMVDVTPSYTQTGQLEIRFHRGGSPAPAYEAFSVNVFNQGAFAPLDELGTITDSLGFYHCRLGEGRYWVVFGVRDPTGSAFVRVRPVEIIPDDTVRVDWDLTPEVYATPMPEPISEREPVPLFVMTDEQGNSRCSREAVGRSPLLIILLHPQHEPSIRMADLIHSWLTERAERAPETLWMLEGERQDYPIGDHWAFDPDKKVGRVFNLQSQDDYPLVVWVDKEGLIAWISKGYNLNIAALLESGRSH